MNPGSSGSRDTLLALDQQMGLPPPTMMTLSRRPEMGTPCEGTQVFAARGLEVNRSLKLSVVGYRQRVSFPPAPYRGQKPADGFRCAIITIQSSPPPPLSCKSKYGVVESLLPAQSNPVFTENPKAGPTSECLTLHSPSPSEPLLCHLQNGSCNL